jgi:hypothetical protein
MKVIKKTRKEIKKYQLAIIKQMLKLATAGFGLVAALAWNEFIRTFINDYLKTKLGLGSGLVSLAIYAVIVTTLAVLVTLQLSRIAERLSQEEKEK